MKKNPFDPPAATSPIQKRFERAIVMVVSLTAALFLITMLFVLREVQHNRELYRMSKLVVEAEEQVAQWREKQRVEEVRAAQLLAVLNTQPARQPKVEILHAGYALAMR